MGEESGTSSSFAAPLEMPSGNQTSAYGVKIKKSMAYKKPKTSKPKKSS
jgi:hypothetical protein